MLLEAAAAEARRLGHPAPGLAHLALALARAAPREFERCFYSGTAAKLATALLRGPPLVGSVDLAGFLEKVSPDTLDALFEAIRPCVWTVVDTAKSSEPPPEPEAEAPWRTGDVILGLYEVIGVA